MDNISKAVAAHYDNLVEFSCSECGDPIMVEFDRLRHRPLKIVCLSCFRDIYPREHDVAAALIEYEGKMKMQGR